MEISTPAEVDLFLFGCNATCLEHLRCRVLMTERARCLVHYIQHRDATMINAILGREPKCGSKLVNVRCPVTGSTALFNAICAEDLVLVKALVKLGASVFVTSYQGVTPLQLAKRCRNKRIESYIDHVTAGMQLLHDVLCGRMHDLERARINFAHPSTGDTALHLLLYAAETLPARDRELRVQLLLQLGADAHSTNFDLIRPVDCLFENRHNLISNACLDWITPRIEHILAEASAERQRDRGLLSLPRKAYRKEYDITEDIPYILTRALHLVVDDAAPPPPPPPPQVLLDD